MSTVPIRGAARKSSFHHRLGHLCTAGPCRMALCLIIAATSASTTAAVEVKRRTQLKLLVHEVTTMALITLYGVAADSTLPPMTVETDKSQWPSANGSDADIKNFHGIGQLRARGYDVSPLGGRSVYQLTS